jgi:hypothetical protein
MRRVGWIVVVVVACNGQTQAPPAAEEAGTAGLGTNCYPNAFACAPGLTCWVQDTETAVCMNAGSGLAGDLCDPVIGTPGCGYDLVCVQFQGWPRGECVAYCDPKNSQAHGCVSPSVCEYTSIEGSGISYYACIPPHGPDAGTTDDASTD